MYAGMHRNNVEIEICTLHTSVPLVMRGSPREWDRS